MRPEHNELKCAENIFISPFLHYGHDLKLCILVVRYMNKFK